LDNSDGERLFEVIIENTSFEEDILGLPFYLQGSVFVYLSNNRILSLDDPITNRNFLDTN
jgi:hypothetical protein